MSHSETGAEKTAEQKADEKRKNCARLAAAAALLLMLAAYEIFFEGWLYSARHGGKIFRTGNAASFGQCGYDFIAPARFRRGGARRALFKRARFRKMRRKSVFAHVAVFFRRSSQPARSVADF